jgi:formylglycine-generating enzyme required for sulfatase activity
MNAHFVVNVCFGWKADIRMVARAMAWKLAASVLLSVAALLSGPRTLTTSRHKARIVQRVEPSHQGAGTLTNDLGMRFVLIPAGTFIMGASALDRHTAFDHVRDQLNLIKANRYDDEGPLHVVRIPHSFYLGQYEVTQSQWAAVMHAKPSTDQRCGGSCPVENISWTDAVHFIEKLNRVDPGHDYRLPTEAEWEYAARGRHGSLVRSNEDTVGWYAGNSGDRYIDSAAVWRRDPNEYARLMSSNHSRPHPVGTRRPNGFGLFDMFGNVWEWVADWYDPRYYGRSPEVDPKGPETGTERVLRGGAFDHDSLINAPVTRVKFKPEGSSESFGLRVALTAN